MGETLYEIVRAGDWIRAKLFFHAKGIMNLSLAVLIELDPDRFSERFEHWTRKAYGFLDSRAFYEGIPGRLRMAYGFWVERELRIGTVNRLSVVKGHPAWANLDDGDRVRAAYKVIMLSMLRCATERTAAYEGRRFGVEAPIVFVDRHKARHLFHTERIPLVETFGPALLEE